MLHSDFGGRGPKPRWCGSLRGYSYALQPYLHVIVILRVSVGGRLYKHADFIEIGRESNHSKSGRIIFMPDTGRAMASCGGGYNKCDRIMRDLLRVRRIVCDEVNHFSNKSMWAVGDISLQDQILYSLIRTLVSGLVSKGRPKLANVSPSKYTSFSPQCPASSSVKAVFGKNERNRPWSSGS